MKKSLQNTSKKYQKPQLIKVSLKELDKKARLLEVHCMRPGADAREWGTASGGTACCQ